MCLREETIRPLCLWRRGEGGGSTLTPAFSSEDGGGGI